MNGAVLVTYGSWCGSTAEVAEEIGKVLSEGGWEVDVLPAGKAKQVDRYQAVVVGTAIRAGRCRGDVTKFVNRNEPALDRVPVAVFSVGLQMQEDTPDNREKALAFLKPITGSVEAVSVGLFGGMVDGRRASFPMSFILKRMPQGDWRDWNAIRAWARDLSAPSQTGGPTDMQYEAYSYRTGSRFGSRVTIEVGSGKVSVTGPRVPVALYRIWLGVQAVLLLAAAASVVLAFVPGFSLWLLAGGPLLILVHLAFGAIGAGCLWEMAGLTAFFEGKKGDTETFPIDAVRDVRIGKGWARNGLWLVILPYVGGINQMAEGHAVSFEAPDGATGRDAVYALHLRTPDEATVLARVLRG